MKPKLDKYDTALLMCIKNHSIQLKHNYEADENTFGDEEKIFYVYDNIASVYADGRCIPLESIRIDHINDALLDIFEICSPNKFKELIQKIINKGPWYEVWTYKEFLFLQLYGYLQALPMLDKNDEEIYDLDYSLVQTKGIKK